MSLYADNILRNNRQTPVGEAFLCGVARDAEQVCLECALSVPCPESEVKSIVAPAMGL